MTDIERQLAGEDMSLLRDSRAGQRLIKELKRRSDEGWNKFIALPIGLKTESVAVEAQANYTVLKSVLEWIEDEIRQGQEARKMTERKARPTTVEAGLRTPRG